MSVHLDHISYYSRVGYYALLAAAVVHALFIPMFFLLGLYTLAGFNVLSVAIYIYCFYLVPEALARKDYTFIGGLVYLELIAHAFLACYFIGLDSGFQYYIYILATVSFFGLRVPIAVNYYRVLFLVFVCVLLEIWMSQTPPQVALDQTYLLAMKSINLSIFIIVAGTVSVLYGKASVSYQDALVDLAMVDELTGLNNRRNLSYTAYKEISRSKRSGDPLSLLLIDVDHYKEVNDRHGHLCGDQIMIDISKILSSICRQEDTVGRWGGDEFMILMPSTSIKDLETLAERIRAIIEQKTFVCKSKELAVTVTLGGSNLTMTDSFLTLISRADDALYRGKSSGRNQYVFGISDD
jgi:diguanylate cyclase (GGDEF)-like protein